MKKIVLLSLLMIPAMLLATGHTDGEVTRYFTQTGRADDFWPRVVNFTLFAIIIIYLVANPIKSFFKGRSQAIAKQLSEIEEKLKMAKEAQKEAQNRLDESEKRAEVILTDAKAEAILLAKKIAITNENELVILTKQLEEKMNLEERKSAREAIDEILSDNITISDILIDTPKVVEILSKKVA